jgi:hypothetical protein
MAGLGQLTDLAHVDDAVSTGATITIPAGALAGDLAVLFDSAANTITGIPALVTPTGWTSDETRAAPDLNRWNISHKILTASDPGAVITGMDGNTDRKLMSVFRGSRPITLVTAADVFSDETSGNPASQTIDAAAGVAPLIVMGFVYGISGGDFSSAVPAFDAEYDGGQAAVELGYKIYDTAPQDHTIDAADTGTQNFLASLYYQLS